MPYLHSREIEEKEISPGIKVKVFISRERGSKSVTMGKGYMESGATLPLHTHKVEDAFIVLSGTGKFTLGDETFDLEPGMAVLSPAGVEHGCINDGSDPLVIIFTWPAVDIELACPPKIGPLEMRDSCRIRTGGSICENEKVFGGAGIQDSQRG